MQARYAGAIVCPSVTVVCALCKWRNVSLSWVFHHPVAPSFEFSAGKHHGEIPVESSLAKRILNTGWVWKKLWFRPVSGSVSGCILDTQIQLVCNIAILIASHVSIRGDIADMTLRYLEGHFNYWKLIQGRRFSVHWLWNYQWVGNHWPQTVDRFSVVTFAMLRRLKMVV